MLILKRLIMNCIFLFAVGNREALIVALDLQTVNIHKVVQEGAPLLRSWGRGRLTADSRGSTSGIYSLRRLCF